MYQKLRESMQAYTDQRAEMDLQDRLIRQAAETLEFTPSEKQLEAELDNQMQNLQAQLAQQGLSLEMYCSFMQTTPDQLRQDARADAQTSIKIQAAIETIVDVENIQASEEEMGQAIAMIARQNKMTVEQLKAYIDPQFQAAVQRSVLSSKAMQLVRDCAEITVTE
jgi:trigger factor